MSFTKETGQQYDAKDRVLSPLEKSRRYVEGLIAANLNSETDKFRDMWRYMRRVYGSYLLETCIDARLAPATTLYPGDGPVLAQWNSFAASSPEGEIARRLNSKNVRGYIVVSHWDGTAPHDEMGFDGCGARSAACAMRNGAKLNLTGAPYIADNVVPHCVDSALEKAQTASYASDGTPCFAIGIDHISQRPHLLGAMVNGRQIVTPNDDFGNGIHEIDPDRIAKIFPDIARMIKKGRRFSESQTQEEKQARRVQDPKLVWVTGSVYPMSAVFDGVPVGEVMRVTYPRHSDAHGYMPRDEAYDIVGSHISYPFANAANESGHGFKSTNTLFIDGKNPEAVDMIWNSIRQTEETNRWLETGDRLVVGAVIRAGKIVASKNLHN